MGPGKRYFGPKGETALSKLVFLDEGEFLADTGEGNSAGWYVERDGGYVPAALRCSGCGRDIPRFARVYVLSICRVDQCADGTMGAFGGEVEAEAGDCPVLGACCLAPSAVERIERLASAVTEYAQHQDSDLACRCDECVTASERMARAHGWWCPCTECVSEAAWMGTR